jgi:hypothetical protein
MVIRRSNSREKQNKSFFWICMDKIYYASIMLEIADVITHANRITELETVMDEIRLLKRAAKRAINEA